MTTALTGTGAAATAAPAKATSERTGIAQNFDAFLQLLTTQLKNQSPLDPLDTNQFTQQLVSFASVEQQLRANDTLSALLTSAKTSTAAGASSFVGLTVSAASPTSRLTGGQAAWSIDPARDVQATITITDADGNVVATQTRALKAGPQTFSWNGRGSNGLSAPDGDYSILATGRDASGQAVSIVTGITGRVDAVDLSGDAPVLLIGSARVPLDNVKSIGGGAQ